MMHRLEPDELLALCDPATLPFKTTDELTPLDGVIGQQRAVSAMEAGIGIKIKVDFDDSLPRSRETELLYARFIAASGRELGLPPFTVDAVARVVEHGSRVVEHQRRLTSRLGMLRDTLREAAFCARRRGGAQVTREDVSAALAARIHRANLIEERIGRHLAEGDLLPSTTGEAVGQINGISVLSTGDHVFGRPSRITVSASAGQRGVVDIEREAKLGGPTHSKGVMILTGFLAGRRFAIHAVATVDEGLGLLSGREAGRRGSDGRFPPGTFNAAVDEALARHVERWRQLRMPVPSTAGGHDGDDHEHSR